MPNIDDQLERARKKAELTDLKIKIAENERQLKINKKVASFVNKYDATDSTQAAKRKQSRPERKSEDNQQTPTERLTGVALGRDLERNAATFRSLQRTLKTMVVGCGPKVQLNTKSPFDRACGEWFNGSYAKWCDGCDDMPLAELVENALAAQIREGDVLCVFDDFDRNDGTLRFYEADQMVTILPQDWENNPRVDEDGDPMLQEHGIIRDKRGRVRFYVFTAERGRQNVPLDEVTIVEAWNINRNRGGSAKLVKRPWRFNQLRGSGEALTIANVQRDVYEMWAAELQSAKNIAQNSAWVEVDPDGEQGVIRALLAAGKDEDEVNAVLYGDGQDNQGMLGQQYEELEGLTGGKTTYANPGEKIHHIQNDRPSPAVSEFADWSQEASGAALGLARSRSTLKAESSYTAYRGEELMSWATVEAMQKSLERRLMDFIAIKSISYALTNNLIAEAPPAGWEYKISWDWPRMKEVDVGRAAQGERVKLKNGTTTWQEILGPQWEEKLESFAEGIAKAKELELPLSVFETVSGSVIEDD